MAEKEIKFSEEDWDKFYERQGSQYFRLESEILEAHGENEKKLLYEIFGSTKILVQAIGVVAGFGFTALGYVENISLFLIGEFFLFVAIFSGLFWTQHAYRANLSASGKEITWVKEEFAARYSVFKKIYDKALADISKGDEISIANSYVRELQKKSNNLLEKFVSRRTESRGGDPFTALMILFAIGGIGLLLSFAHLSIF